MTRIQKEPLECLTGVLRHATLNAVSEIPLYHRPEYSQQFFKYSLRGATKVVEDYRQRLSHRGEKQNPL